MKRNPLIRFTKLLLDFIFYSGIIVCAGVPLIFRQAGKYYNIFDKYYSSLCIIFMIAGIFALLIFWNLRNIFKSVIRENPFVRENMIYLKRMGICAFVIAALMAVRLFIVITPAALVLVGVFIIAGLFSLVLSLVFDQAVTYKQENDLTI